MTELDLDAIRARAKAATEGPWFAASQTRRKDGIALVGVASHAIAVLAAVYVRQCHLDAEFIAQARDDVPALVDEVERLRVKVRALENQSSLRADAQQRRPNRKKIDADLMGLGRAGPWTS